MAEPKKLTRREKVARWLVAGAAAMQLGSAQPMPERAGTAAARTEIQASANERVQNLRDLEEAARRMNDQQRPAQDQRRDAMQRAKAAQERTARPEGGLRGRIAERNRQRGRS